MVEVRHVLEGRSRSGPANPRRHRVPVAAATNAGGTPGHLGRALPRHAQVVTLEGGMRAWSLAWNTAEATISGQQVVQVRRTGKGCLSYIVESGSEALVIDASVDPAVYVRVAR